MDRLDHVKIVSPDPAAIDRFLREVLDIPEGWAIGSTPPAPGPAPSGGALTIEAVLDRRGGDATGGGFITGSTQSRQFQVFRGERPQIWAVAIGTRHLERAHERCVERGIPCTEPSPTEWGDGTIRFFFAEVGGILFEVMRAEPR
jgi:catechol 2,3-dioxygenase-like lactoylglutathione lyase family enzyme